LDLKQQLVNQALRLMQDPRVVKAMQNPKVMQGLMGALQLRAKVQQNVETSVQRMAKRFNLATEAEVRELRRTVRRLEREVEAYRVAQTGNGAS
jgi:polyhydroxyalkanoate synthesis regulator phasin